MFALEKNNHKINALLAQPDQIPPLPETAVRLQQLLENDTSSIPEIAEVIRYDPTLTSKILKIANSAFYNFSHQVSTVERAINIIGTEALYNLALANSAVSTFAKITIKEIDQERFWRHSVDTGLIAKSLAKELKLKNTERFFVCGLLANFGELLCAIKIPEATQAASFDTLSDTQVPWEIQMHIHGFTYPQLTQHLLELWRFPPTISQSIGYLHHPKSCPHLKEAQILNVAYRASLANGESDVRKHLLYQDSALTDLKLPSSSLEQAIELANIEAIGILSIINPVATILF